MKLEQLWTVIVSFIEVGNRIADMEPGEVKDSTSTYIAEGKHYMEGYLIHLLTKDGADSSQYTYELVPGLGPTDCSVVIKDGEAAFSIVGPQVGAWSYTVRV